MKHRPKGEPGLELRLGLKDRSSRLCGDHTAALGPEARVPAQGTGLPEVGLHRGGFQAVTT